MMKEFDALDQGDTSQEHVDNMDFEMEPVTDSDSDKEGQKDEGKKDSSKDEKKDEKKTDPDSRTAINQQNKEKRVEIKKTKISQEEWQDSQDRIQNLEQKNDNLMHENVRTKFEAKNPIVLTEKYSKTWEEVCEAKKNPEHKYHKLDFEDLLRIVRDPEANAEAEKELKSTKQITVPPFGGSSRGSSQVDGIDPDVHASLKAAGYTDEEIKRSGSISV